MAKQEGTAAKELTPEQLEKQRLSRLAKAQADEQRARNIARLKAMDTETLQESVDVAHAFMMACIAMRPAQDVHLTVAVAQHFDGGIATAACNYAELYNELQSRG